MYFWTQKNPLVAGSYVHRKYCTYQQLIVLQTGSSADLICGLRDQYEYMDGRRANGFRRSHKSRRTSAFYEWAGGTCVVLGGGGRWSKSTSVAIARAFERRSSGN